MSVSYGRKHKLEQAPRAKKRMRLDAMFESLSLDGPKVYINPLAVPEQDHKKQKPNIDSIISGKIYESYKQDLLRGYQVIRYRHPIFVLYGHFQAWVRRLFNVFIRKFNRQNPNLPPMKTFRYYVQIVALVEDPNVNFTLSELLHIVMQESVFEVSRIARKREKVADSARMEEIKEQEDAAKECNYKYWDRLRTRPDVEMENALDLDMDMDGANYGNYYSQGM